MESSSEKPSRPAQCIVCGKTYTDHSYLRRISRNKELQTLLFRYLQIKADSGYSCRACLQKLTSLALKHGQMKTLCHRTVRGMSEIPQVIRTKTSAGNISTDEGVPETSGANVRNTSKNISALSSPPSEPSPIVIQPRNTLTQTPSGTLQALGKHKPLPRLKPKPDLPPAKKMKLVMVQKQATPETQAQSKATGLISILKTPQGSNVSVSDNKASRNTLSNTAQLISPQKTCGKQDASVSASNASNPKQSRPMPLISRSLLKSHQDSGVVDSSARDISLQAVVSCPTRYSSTTLPVTQTLPRKFPSVTPATASTSDSETNTKGTVPFRVPKVSTKTDPKMKMEITLPKVSFNTSSGKAAPIVCIEQSQLPSFMAGKIQEQALVDHCYSDGGNEKPVKSTSLKAVPSEEDAQRINVDDEEASDIQETVITMDDDMDNANSKEIKQEKGGQEKNIKETVSDKAAAATTAMAGVEAVPCGQTLDDKMSADSDVSDIKDDQTVASSITGVKGTSEPSRHVSLFHGEHTGASKNIIEQKQLPVILFMNNTQVTNTPPAVGVSQSTTQFGNLTTVSSTASTPLPSATLPKFRQVGNQLVPVASSSDIGPSQNARQSISSLGVDNSGVSSSLAPPTSVMNTLILPLPASSSQRQVAPSKLLSPEKRTLHLPYGNGSNETVSKSTDTLDTVDTSRIANSPVSSHSHSGSVKENIVVLRPKSSSTTMPLSAEPKMVPTTDSSPSAGFNIILNKKNSRKILRNPTTRHPGKPKPVHDTPLFFRSASSFPSIQEKMMMVGRELHTFAHARGRKEGELSNQEVRILNTAVQSGDVKLIADEIMNVPLLRDAVLLRATTDVHNHAILGQRRRGDVSLLMKKGLDLGSIEESDVVRDFAHHHSLLFHVILAAMLQPVTMGTRWRQEDLLKPLAAVYGIVMQANNSAKSLMQQVLTHRLYKVAGPSMPRRKAVLNFLATYNITMMYTSTLLNPQLRLTEMQVGAASLTSPANAESEQQEEETNVSSKDVVLVEHVHTIDSSAEGNTQSVLQEKDMETSSKEIVEIVEQIVHTAESDVAVNELLGAEVIGEMEFISM